MEALEPHRVRAGLDLFVVPDFARKHLGLSDPQAYLSQLERAYPVAGAGDAIAPNESVHVPSAFSIGITGEFGR